jgi:PhnB protein
MTGTENDGENVDLWFRHTVGLRKADGRWRIVHEHESVPSYMDGSYKAAVDLLP